MILITWPSETDGLEEAWVEDILQVKPVIKRELAQHGWLAVDDFSVYLVAKSFNPYELLYGKE